MARDMDCGGEPIERPKPRRTMLPDIVTLWIGIEMGDKTSHVDSAIARTANRGGNRDTTSEINCLTRVGMV